MHGFLFLMVVWYLLYTHSYQSTYVTEIRLFYYTVWYVPTYSIVWEPEIPGYALCSERRQKKRLTSHKHNIILYSVQIN